MDMQNKMMLEEIKHELFRMQDINYRDFHRKLIPTVSPGTVIGVRTPDLRKYAKRLGKQDGIQRFLCALPHAYYEENQLHAFLVSDIKDFDRCMEEVW